MSNPRDYFLTLCNLWCEQQLSVDQVTEFQTLLRSDKDLQQIFVELIQLHGQLAWDAGVVVGSDLTGISDDTTDSPENHVRIAPAIPLHKSRYSVGFVAACAACLLLAGIATINWHGSDALQLAKATKEPGDGQNPGSANTLPGMPEPSEPQRHVLGNSASNELKPLELSAIQSEFAPPEVAANDPDAESPSESVTTVAVDDASIIFEINRLIAAAWSANNVIAADVAEDYEWIRRCYLTLTGRIPTVSEASMFVTSASPRKHTELVDSLLEDRRFAENLSVTWTNLLIGRTNARNVDQDALYRFLQRQFLKNRPWMETVGELVAAQGRSDQNGATNFLLAHLNDQATPATAVTARLFLGQQVQCTQCHDHPFVVERSQGEFWSLNAFFKQAERRPLTVTTAGGESQDVWTLTDTGSPGMTFYETRRGQQRAVLPEFDGHAMSADDSKSRRAELVRLLAADSRQTVAQAMINRTWAQVFGYGFTNPIDDLGPHNPVSHSELLEFLAKSFVASDYDLRRLMRWLTLSQAFQLSSVQAEQSFAIDGPQEGGAPLFSRAYPRPMGPEQVYDSIRIAIRSAADQPIDSSIGTGHRREWVEQFVESYGTDENDEQLAFEGNITQAMLMMNGEDLQAAIPLTAAEVIKSVYESPQDATKSLERIAMATLNREPSEQEKNIFLGRYRTLSRSVSADQAIHTATEDMLWAYLNSSEFTSVH